MFEQPKFSFGLRVVGLGKERSNPSAPRESIQQITCGRDARGDLLEPRLPGHDLVETPVLEMSTQFLDDWRGVQTQLSPQLGAVGVLSSDFNNHVEGGFMISVMGGRFGTLSRGFEDLLLNFEVPSQAMSPGGVEIDMFQDPFSHRRFGSVKLLAKLVQQFALVSVSSCPGRFRFPHPCQQLNHVALLTAQRCRFAGVCSCRGNPVAREVFVTAYNEGIHQASGKFLGLSTVASRFPPPGAKTPRPAGPFPEPSRPA